MTATRSTSTRRARARRFLLVLLSSCVLFLCMTAAALGVTLPPGFVQETWTTGLTGPIAMAFAPDARIFVTEKVGRVRILKSGVLYDKPFVTVTVDSTGERGLLGIALDPSFASNHFVYVYYTATTPTVHNRVSRFTASGDVALAGSEKFIFDLDPLSSSSNHNGGAIHFGNDGKLYISVGDNLNSANAQSLTSLNGKMLRINADGTIPTDNPFYSQTTGKYRAIWARGLRNPFTFGVRRTTGRIFINDVGENTWEEINDGVAGANYGWPTCEGLCSPANPAYRNPIYAYANDSATCAITGGTFYDPQTRLFPTSYVGKYFFEDYCAGWIKTFDPATGAVGTFATGLASPADLGVSPWGSLYYIGRGNGSLNRIRYTG